MTKLTHKLDTFRPDDINICPLLGINIILIIECLSCLYDKFEELSV